MGILIYIISMVILYVVIQTAVRKGIDSSKTAQLLKDKYDIKEPKDPVSPQKSFLDDDLDK